MHSRKAPVWQTIFVLVTALVLQISPSFAEAPTPAVAPKHRVDIALVLAVDVSSSIETSERRFQREAYAQALQDPRVAQMALGGRTGRVAIAYMEWSGRSYQRVHVPMRIMSSSQELSSFAQAILAIEDHPADPMYHQATAVGDALFAAETAMSELQITAREYVIDISGDGVLNDGSAVQIARAHVLSRGVTVNGLPIELTSSSQHRHELTTIETVSRFYADCVIGGPGAFHLVARGFGDVRETLIMKLMLEMAEMPADQKRRIASAWNEDSRNAVARIIPAMAIELSPSGSAPEQKADCSSAGPMVFVP